MTSVAEHATTHPSRARLGWRRALDHGRSTALALIGVAIAALIGAALLQPSSPGVPDRSDSTIWAAVEAEQKISASAGGLAAPLAGGDHFGISVASLGDVDGDGVTDLAVGARGDDDGGVDSGAVYVLFLNNDGTVRAEQKISRTQGGLVGPIDNGDQFGFSVSGLGDLDGDGLVDMAVSAWGDDDGGTDRGAVYVLFLNANGTVRAEQKISDTSGGFAATLLDFDNFGSSVSQLGDLDGDSVVDLAVGAWADNDGGGVDRGAAYILFLNTDGTVRAEQKISAVAGGLTGPLDASDTFGNGLAGIGDVDGDGIVDLAVGVPRDDDGGLDRGAVYILFLNTDGTVRAEQKISTLEGGFVGPLQDSDQFGIEVAGLGDVDGDGIVDIAVGAWLTDDGGSDRGRVYVLYLNADGTVRAENTISSTQGGFTGPLDDFDNFGHGVAGLGDLDGDGTVDLAVGVFRDDDGAVGNDHGAVYVLDLTAHVGNLVMVTGDGGFGLGQDAAYKAFYEQLGYVVSAIDDDAAQAVFDDAAAANTLMYLSHTAVPGTATKARTLDIGIVAASSSHWNALMYEGSSSTGSVFASELDVVDTTQYVTDPFAPGPLTVLSSSQSLTFWNAGSVPLPAGAQVLGERTGTPTQVAPIVFETGSELASGNTATNRRVFLPFQSVTFSTLNTDGLALLERSSIWAAGLDPALPMLVNSTLDLDDVAPGDGICDTGTLNSELLPACTLRAALTEANADTNADRIEFDIPLTEAGFDGATGVWTIAMPSSVLAITSPVEIVGATQTVNRGDTNPGVLGATRSVGTGPDGITGTGDEPTIDGVPAPEVELDFDAQGLRVESDGVVISGLAMFGGNSDVWIQSGADTVVTDNVIGTRASSFTDPGAVDRSFGAGGVVVAGGSNSTIAGNLIGFQNYRGINVYGDPANVTISGNEIRSTGQAGTDEGGGIELTGFYSPGSAVDGVTITGNLVVGTIGDMGVEIATSPSDVGIVVSDNSVLGNSVLMYGDQNPDGGTLRHNEIRDADLDGVIVDLVSGWSILGNSIADSFYRGVALLNSANDSLSAPNIDAASSDGATIDVDYALSAPANTYRVEFFTNAEADPTGFGEGERFAGSATVVHPGGSASYSATVVGARGGFVSSTLTIDEGAGEFGSTSDFSSAFAVACGDGDGDGDGLCDDEEDGNGDGDTDPTTDPGPDTDGDGTPNYLDADDDGDGISTASENPDPNGDGDPRDARDVDRDGQPDYLDAPTMSTAGTVADEQKISDLVGGLTATLDNLDWFGNSTVSVGDLDGDGVVDLAVGAYGDDDGGVPPDANRGAVHILFMNADGTVRAEQKISDTAGGLAATLDNWDLFGSSLAGIGDLDGDGTPDLAVGAYGDDDGGTDRGAVYVLLMNPNGTVRSERKISDTAGGLAATLDNIDGFGFAVAGLGDVDGDGIADLAVGAYGDDDGGTDRGAVYVLFMNADGTVRAEQKISDTVGGLAVTLDNSDYFGSAVATVGDLDGDGTSDLVAGAYGDDDGGNDRGAVHALFLNTDGTVRAEQKISDTVGGLAATLDNSDLFGLSVAGIGDVDGDGVPDLVVGASVDDDGGTDRGAVYVLFLNADGTVRAEQKISDTTGDLAAPLDDSDRFGYSVAGIGDLDGDGSIGIVVGAAYDDDGGNSRGAVYILDLSLDQSPPMDLALNPSSHTVNDNPVTTIGAQTGSTDTSVTLAGGRTVDLGIAGNVVTATIREADTTLVDTVTILDYADSGDLFGTAPEAVVAAHPNGGFLVAVRANGYIGNGNHGGVVVGFYHDADGAFVPHLPQIVSGGAVPFFMISLDSGSHNNNNTYRTNPTLDIAGDGTITASWNNTSAGVLEQRIFTLSGPRVDENATPGTIVATITGTDPDTGDILTYDIPGGDPDFEIIGTALRVRTGADLDYESATAHTISIRVTDNTGLSYTETVTININNLADSPCEVDTDNDGLWNCEEDANTDADGDPGTNPEPDTDGDGTPNYLDADDDGDGTPTASENADPNGDGDPRDALDSDWDGQPDWLDVEAGPSTTPIADEQKISDLAGGLAATLDDSDFFGASVTGVGDLDGDGTNDIVVGANFDDDGGTNRGAIHILHLNPDGTVKAEQKISDLAGGLAATLDDSDYFGASVTGVGDLDGDGTDDIVVGANFDDDGGTNRGAIHILHLNPDGTVKAEQKISDLAGGLTATLDDYDYFGASVTGVGDLDGDGTNDIVVGANFDDDGGTNRGAIHILHLNPDGTVKAEQKISDLEGGLTATLDDYDYFGASVTGVGDLDGDGTNDIVVGANFDDDGGTNRGAIHILHLNPDGTVKAEQKISDLEGGLTATLDDSDYFGASVTGVGDLDGDGTDDIAVAAHFDDDGGTNRGAIHILHLNPDGTVKAEQKISDLEGGLTATLDDNDYFGASVTGIGDLDGDGTNDIVVGADLDDDGGPDRGAVYILDLSRAPVVVNSTGDAPDVNPGNGVCETATPGECTLRAAIAETNVNPALDTIHFDIPGPGPIWTIAPNSQLPVVTAPVVVDATTQPGWSGDPVVVIDGSAATFADGFNIAAGSTEIRGFVIVSFNGDGIDIGTNGGNTIAGNWIGLAADGTTIAGVADDGIVANEGANANLIGGPGPNDGNVISGNVSEGILLWSDDNVVQGNLLGTDVTGLLARGNGDEGLDLNTAVDTVVIDNVISGNSGDGVQVLGSDGSTFTGNLIGVGSDGTTPLGNVGDGITVNFGASVGVRIGGTGVGDGNTIAHNGDEGISIFDSLTDDIAVLGNSIHSNAALGIDLLGDGVTPNDANDVDGGVNDLLNFPVITSASESGGTVTVDVDLDVPAGTYRIEAFTNPSGTDPSGYGEGEVVVGSATVVHTGGGTESFVVTYGGGWGDRVTLTATEEFGGGAFGSTSEFSAAVTVVATASPIVVVNSTGTAGDVAVGDGVCETSTPGECTLRAAIAEANAHPTIDTIHFAIPGAGPTWTIAAPDTASGTPVISAPVTIDATTQPGWAGDPIVVLDGSAVTGGDGFFLGAGSGGSEIRGFVIGGYPGGDGIQITTSGNTIAGNWIGTDATGNVSDPIPNGAGIYVSGGTGNLIGGPTPADRNVIGGTANGINVSGEAVDGTQVVGNHLGVGADGSSDVGNTGNGIVVLGGADDTLVAANVIGFNDLHGLSIVGATSGTTVQNNLIGVGVDGTSPAPNASHAVALDGGASNNLIGGITPGDGNVVANTNSAQFDGVRVFTSAGSGNVILGNSIYGKGEPGGLGIDLGDADMTPNDAGDVDTGANDLLNFPEISSVTVTTGTADVVYTLDVPAGNYRVEFFANPSGADPTGFGEGEEFVHAETVSHAGFGPAGLTASFAWPGGDMVTATATEDLGAGTFGSTSEFSQARCVDSDGDGLCDVFEVPYGDTDGDGIPNYLDADDDGDGFATLAENADPNGDGDPRDALDSDHDGQPDYLDLPTAPTGVRVATEQQIGSLVGGFTGPIEATDLFGKGATSVGDVDGDGIVDIAVTAPYDDDGGQDRGAIYVLFLNADGTVRVEQKISSTEGGLVGPLDDVDVFGWSITGLGDLDGDGRNELAVGTVIDDDGALNAGAVYVLFLNADGTVRDEQKISATSGGLSATLDPSDFFGAALAAPGDVDGDGIEDLVVGAYGDDDGGSGRGAAYVLFLNADGSVRAEQKISSSQGGLGALLADFDSFGSAVGAAGDLDNDGVVDLAVGANGDDTGGSNRGAVYVLFLNADGTVRASHKIADLTGGFSATLDDADQFGSGIASVGDLDGDGTKELLVGAPGDGDGGSGRGAVHILSLDTDGTVVANSKISSTSGGFTGPLLGGDSFGRSVSSVGDLDGDGTIGIVVGAENRGAVFVIDLAGPNVAPVADTGGPYAIAEGDALPIDASGSTDADLDTLTYGWDLDNDGLFDDVFGASPAVPWSALASYGVDDDGVYPIAVSVDDGNGASDIAATTVTVADTPPTIAATGPSTISPGATFTLDLSVSDPGDDTVTAWHISWGDGTFDTIAGNPSTASHTYASFQPMPIRVAVTDEDGIWRAGDVFVADFALGQAIQLDGITGNNVFTFPMTPPLDQVAGVLVAPDGLLYVSDFVSDSVVRFDPSSGAHVDTFVASGSGGLEGAADMVIAPDGSLLVASYFSDSIERYDGVSGAHLGSFAPAGTGGLDGPIGMTYGPDGNLYVVNWVGTSVVRFDPVDGTPLGAFATGVAAQPTAAGFAPDGDLYLIGRNTGRLDRYDGATGAFIETVATPSTAFGLAVEPDGTFLVGSEFDETISRYAFDGTPLETFASNADGLLNPWLITREPAHWVTFDAITVNSTGDTGDANPGDGVCDTGGPLVGGDPECTLRAAIEEANAIGRATIHFDIPTSDAGHAGGVWTIAPAVPLPPVTARVTIDATTQPGTVVNTATFPDPMNSRLAVQLSGASLLTGSDGIWLTAGSSGSEIRGLAINGFVGDGAESILVSSSSNSVIVGNHFGSDTEGLVTVPNNVGIAVFGVSADTRIGGPSAADRNLFVDQTYSHLSIAGVDVSGTIVQGNEMGYLTGGAPSPALVGFGVVSYDGANATLVGGTGVGEGNRIARAWKSVLVDANANDSSATLLGNHIDNSFGWGIDLLNDGVTANDPGDVDSGPNDLLNFPVLRTVDEVDGVVTVGYDLDVPPGDYRIEFFANDASGPSGYGAGEVFVHAAMVSHPGGGDRSFVASFPAGAGNVITATTTQSLGAGLYGATSEFSLAVAALPAGAAFTEHSGRLGTLDALGGADAAVPAAGITANAVELDGSTERLTAPTFDVTSGELSVSGWIRLDTSAGTPRLVSRQAGGTAILDVFVSGTTPTARLHVGGTQVEVTGGTVGLGAWHQVAASWDGSVVTLYVDGAPVDNTPAVGPLATDVSASLVVGNTESAANGLDGRIDNVRISRVARSPEWILTEFANVTEADRFVTLGAPQTSVPGSWTTTTGTVRSGSHALAAPATVAGADAWATARGVDEPGIAFEAWWFVSDPATTEAASGTITGTAPTDQYEAGITVGDVDLATNRGGDRTVDATTGTSIAPGVWTRVEILTDELGRSRVVVDGVEALAPTAHSAPADRGSFGVRVGALSSGEVVVDDVRARRYVSDEPVTTLGPILRS
ncbi:MAG: LamG-like jellyroll fold domain-containing protein [Ilumatobacter sp.]|uniref:LamG-like jellyroll fold domain-containing protein n=1 Tax=Ilumatobacter sp. TaxID=1967498 RepID=UPI00391AF19F